MFIDVFANIYGILSPLHQTLPKVEQRKVRQRRGGAEQNQELIKSLYERQMYACFPMLIASFDRRIAPERRKGDGCEHLLTDFWLN
jgi:hypothetical protein